MADERLTLKEAAEHAGVTPATLQRWARSGLIPHQDGAAIWTPRAAAHARLVARLRQRGHTLASIRQASRDGRLAYSFIEALMPRSRAQHTLKDAARETGLETTLIERIWLALGLPQQGLDGMGDEDLAALRYVASVLDSGFPLVAFLQLARVYGQSLAQIADAETRLFHIYVHEPLMRDGVPGVQMAEEMENLARDLLPLAGPIMDYTHQRFLQHFMEQDVVGHMEGDLDSGDDAELGRVRIVIAFADLAGYTRFTEEEGEDEALSYVERFIDAVSDTIPDDSRVIKTIGDEVMVVGSDAQALTDWAVGFQRLWSDRPAPRIGVHTGSAVYRDGDYFGREVNLASRIVARARGGEVLVSDAVVEAGKGADHLQFEAIGHVKLKGFDEPRALYRAHGPE